MKKKKAKNKEMVIEGIEISNSDKIIFPQKNISKGEMVSYYERIAPLMLPFLKDRPLTLQRFPNGINESGFYQKNASDHFPDFIQTVNVETEEGSNIQVICNDKKSLVYLANQGTLVFHTWLSKKDKIKQPDKIIFDLDPSSNSFDEVKEAAILLRKFLQSKGIEPSVMTSGKNGLHLFYKIRRGKDFDQVKTEVKNLAEEVTIKHPQIFTTALRKDQRKGKIFIDYLRNAYAQTAVCAYSLRANEEAGIATPIEWEELSKIKNAAHYHFKNIFRRTGQLNNN